MAKQTGMNATLKIGVSPTQTTVGGLTSIGLPKRSKEMVETTTMDSVDHYKEYLPGVKNGGTLSLAGLFNGSDEGQTALMTAFDADTLDDYEIALGNGDKFTCKAYVQAFEMGDAKDNEAVAFTCTLQINGKPTYTKAV